MRENERNEEREKKWNFRSLFLNEANKSYFYKQLIYFEKIHTRGEWEREMEFFLSFFLSSFSSTLSFLFQIWKEWVRERDEKFKWIGFLMYYQMRFFYTINLRYILSFFLKMRLTVLRCIHIERRERERRPHKNVFGNSTNENSCCEYLLRFLKQWLSEWERPNKNCVYILLFINIYNIYTLLSMEKKSKITWN